MTQHGEPPVRVAAVFAARATSTSTTSASRTPPRVYRAYVARDPYSDHAPDLDMAAIEAYGKGGFSQLVLDGKHEFVEHYNFDSPYWKTRSRADHPSVVQELKINLKDVATYFHATAQKIQEGGRLPGGRALVPRLPEVLPRTIRIPPRPTTCWPRRCSRATSTPSAATEYEHTAYDYPKNEKSATAAYAALVSYQKGEESLQGAEKAGLAQARHRRRGEVRADLPRASRQRRRAHARGGGDLRYRRPAARDHGRAVDPGAPAAGGYRQATHRLDHHRAVVLRPGRVRQGGTGLRRRRASWRAPNDTMRADLTERLAATVYKQGEAKKKAGDTAGAVEDFLRVSRVAPESKIRPNAQYDAATAADQPQAVGPRDRRARGLPPPVPAESAAAGGHAQARRRLLLGQPPGRGRRGVRAHRRESRRGQGGAARSADAVGGSVRQGGQHAQGLGDAGEVRGHQSDAAGRCRGGAPAPGRLRRQERRCGAARSLVPRDHQCGCPGRRAAHRAHALPGGESAARPRAAGARCVPRRAAHRAAEEEPDRQAQRARDGDGWLQARRRVPGGRSDHRGHL